jgi:hypothetical protein
LQKKKNILGSTIKNLEQKMQSKLFILLQNIILSYSTELSPARAFRDFFETIGMATTPRVYLPPEKVINENAEILKTFLQNHPDISDDEFDDTKWKVIQKVGGLGSCVSNWSQLFTELRKEYEKLYNVPRSNPFTSPMRRLHCCVGSGSTSIQIYVDTPSDEILRDFQKKFPDVSFSIELVKQ